jgi:4-hydroxyphenylpyruvate dioxygenase
VATVCFSGTLADKLAAAAAAGFDGVEIFENDLIAAPWSPEELHQRCADLGLSIDLYQPFRDFEAVPTDLLAANLRRAERKFDLMRRLGADTLLVCSSVSPATIDDDHLAAQQLRALAELAADRGMRVAYEALAWGRFVRTWNHSWEIVRRADHPALGLCLDSFHVLSRGSDPAEFTRIPGHKLFFVQLADAPHLDMDVLQWSRHHRLFPGQGAFDLTTFLGHVLDAGYPGPLSLEVFNDVFRQANPTRTAIDAMRSLLNLQEQVAHRLPASALPPAPPLTGHAFTEITVGDTAHTPVANTLGALGFTCTGQHRTKPIQLWQQRDARVLLNPSANNPRTAEVSALAVQSSDPPTSALRAEALHAPLRPRTRAASEADLSSVAAPDGTVVYFCRTGADGPGSWLDDFSPTHAQPTPVGLTHTDHVALAQPFDSFDEATLFYRSVLGLAPRPDDEYTAPFGLMRSRAVADPSGRVRIALNGTLLRRGDWAPGIPDPQHIAFATNNIIATARALRKHSAPILSIPDNYYEDLDARIALDPALLTELRECHVLYDRDDHGAYFHLYTEVLGSRLFFEVVQRANGYTGYGASNAPVRMASHRETRLQHQR